MTSSCPFCDCKSSFYLRVFGDELHRCSSCKLVFLYPYPSQEQMVARHLSREYAEHPYFQAGEDMSAQGETPLHSLAFSALSRHIPRDSRVLDVGAGAGDFVRAASSRFPNVEGLEPSPHLARRARERSGKVIIESSFENFSPDTPYDAVVLMDIIEHTADPRAVLAKAKELLKPGGMVFICTVNSSSLLYKLSPIISAAASLSRKARYILERIYCYQHNWYFNERALAGIVRDAGFEMILHERYEYPLDRLRESRLIIAGLRMIYLLQRLLGSSTEQYLLARRKP